ncbi:unnamed protein product [Notodromas monacha]|uniref:Uncharacterized protein n=1 Tax=Notodromas monacha TaxID=399045 RepID=A0A7R9G996_9CRUS|nr:unnamed protein product [Notodromas monacha]CAG0912382.1 unnamed protein product [Notodromas monacha]
MTEHVEAWLEHFKNMHITIGPVFDYDGDGIKDELNKSVPAIPSHIFYIFKRCLEDPDEYAVQQCPEESLDAIAVVLPNDEENVNCEAPPEFLSRHSARIRDIEMLTGLYFPQAQDTTENLRLRMKVPGKVWPMTPRILGQHSTAHHSD